VSLPPVLLSLRLSAAGAAHGFFGRAGGVSTGVFASLNAGLGAGDAVDAVAENRARCARRLEVAPERLVTLHQIHSARCVIVEDAWPTTDRPAADAMASARPGVALGILAADCMPFLFVDAAAGVVGAAHAGWRGALAGVLEETIAAMTSLGARPHRIEAALGPCLRQANFEVGRDVLEAFTDKHAAAADFFAPGRAADKRQLDLAAFGRWRLAESGVDRLDDLGLCTLAEPERFFSYRASRRAGAADYGRNLSAVALRA
jgi:hypothetical protein